MKKKGIEKEPYMDTAKFSKIIVYLLISTTLENMQITSWNSQTEVIRSKIIFEWFMTKRF